MGRSEEIIMRALAGVIGGGRKAFPSNLVKSFFVQVVDYRVLSLGFAII